MGKDLTERLATGFARTGPRSLALGEREIRAALVSHLSCHQTDNAEAVLIEELGLCCGRVRVDVALVSSLLHGFEIKSDHDSLRRLDLQIEIYSKVLNLATLVVGIRHAEHAASLIPEWWGIRLAERTPNGVVLRRLRKERRNPFQDPRALVELVWLEDARRLLDERNASRGYRGKPRRLVWDRVCELYDVDEIAAVVRSSLMARTIAEAPQLSA